MGLIIQPAKADGVSFSRCYRYIESGTIEKYMRLDTGFLLGLVSNYLEP